MNLEIWRETLWNERLKKFRLGLRPELDLSVVTVSWHFDLAHDTGVACMRWCGPHFLHSWVLLPLIFFAVMEKQQRNGKEESYIRCLLWCDSLNSCMTILDTHIKHLGHLGLLTTILKIVEDKSLGLSSSRTEQERRDPGKRARHRSTNVMKRSSRVGPSTPVYPNL